MENISNKYVGGESHSSKGSIPSSSKESITNDPNFTSQSGNDIILKPYIRPVTPMRQLKRFNPESVLPPVIKTETQQRESKTEEVKTKPKVIEPVNYQFKTNIY